MYSLVYIKLINKYIDEFYIIRSMTPSLIYKKANEIYSVSNINYVIS